MNNLSQVTYKSRLKIHSLPYNQQAKQTHNNYYNQIHIKRDTYTPIKQSYNLIQNHFTILKNNIQSNNIPKYQSLYLQSNNIGQTKSSEKYQQLHIQTKSSNHKIKHKIFNVQTLTFNNQNQNNINKNTQIIQSIKSIKYQKYQKSDFIIHHMLGKGGFGKVWKVQNKITHKLYAMKQMTKSIVITKNSIQSIINQRLLLTKLNHIFLINIYSSFQDKNNLYILMQLMEGGDLRYHLSTKIIFTQFQAKFMIASILLCLKYLHTNGIVHRDIKPENIVFDKQGYAYLTDLGIAKNISDFKCNQTSGTPGYMAPEVLFHKSHQFQVDFFGLGVILYEIMMNCRPYKGRDRQQIRLAIKKNQVIIQKKQIPQSWTIQAADFTNKLLQRKPINRLGWNGVKQVMSHCWFSNIPWQKIQQKSIQPPKKRTYEYQKVQYKKSQPSQEYLKMLKQNQKRVQIGQLQCQFRNYSYYQLDKQNNLLQ